MPSTEEWTLVVSGGGSGGHLFPAIAVIEELQKSFPPQRVLCFTSDRSIERTILTQQAVEQVPLLCAEMRSRRPLRTWLALRKAQRAAEKILRDLPNPMVLGTGGFSSIPGVLAARMLNRPVLLLEQNIVPGMATSWLCRPLAPVCGIPLPLPVPSPVLVCSSFEKCRTRLPKRTSSQLTGNPVRPGIVDAAATAQAGRGRTLLVLGGSQGTAALNAAMAACFQNGLARGWHVVHQTGERDYDVVRRTYEQAGVDAEVSPFFEDMAARYAQASFAVSRAGGTTLAELACMGVPAILVPYPGSVRDHQRRNAEHFVEAGAALMIEQDHDDARFHRQLSGQLQTLTGDDARRAEMSTAMRTLAMPDAARKVAKSIRFLVRNWNKVSKR
jgi:UDP-N-acetylglucosamine--N-acetylmuramyl-(pentapeptide) pyrophosphoryl-undecaprenol N-acetylglucosamine transferase